MAVPRLFGIETEYAISHMNGLQPAISREELVNRLMVRAGNCLTHVLSNDGRGVFLDNGGRLYIDLTNHPEYATAECSHPQELAGKIREADGILDMLGQKLENAYGGEILIWKANVDYVSRSAWGCHESFMIKRGCEINKHLIPFLVSRQIYTGAGGWNSQSAQMQFVLSPRVPYLEHVVSRESTHERGIIHQADVRHRAVDWSADYARIHLITGESLFSETSIVLKAGVTALVAGLIEAGLEPGNGITLKNPLQAMREFTADTTCKAVAECDSGKLTAIEIQRHYLNLAERNFEKLPVWAEGLCVLWREVLDGLESGAEQKRLRLDWVIRHQLFRQHVESSGQTEQEARLQLFEMDMKFGRVGAKGIFRQLEARGCLDHHVPDGLLVEEPVKTRARVRGTAIRDCHTAGNANTVFADWHFLNDTIHGLHMSLNEPFTTNGAWTPRLNPVSRRRRAIVLTAP
jgi:proteasome accessory factor A